MILHPGASDEIAGQMTGRIVDAVRPWRVILFGSRARGNAQPNSDYDLFVEVDADGAALKEIGRRIRLLFSDAGWALDCKVRRCGTLEQRRDDPGAIEWDVAREGELLYADPSAPTLLLPPDRVREPSPDPPPSAHEWLGSAERDWRHCQALWATGNDYWPEICWLSQQTCEKHLKALLIARRIHPGRTHALIDLLTTARAAGCPLPGLDEDCALLTAHAVAPRYPEGLDLAEADARAAYAAAERIVNGVRAHLPRRLH